METIGRVIKWERLKKGISILSLSEKSGVSQIIIQNIEEGKNHQILLIDIMEITFALNISFMLVFQAYLKDRVAFI
jgi:transcriptional regulator with XRE-family HTH domain